MKNWIKRLVERSPSERPAPATTEREKVARTSGEQNPAAIAHAYSSDQPIRSRSEDRFNRWGFAARIADTIAGRRDPSSIVIGLYGPWGDGKTSALRLMEEALEAHPHVVVVRFNPWHFQSDVELMKGFFATLAQAIDESLPTTKEQVGEFLKKYGTLLSLAWGSAGTAAKGLGETLSTVGLDALRSRIEELLAESGKRVVILVDDIDRLDRSETHAIFKLVKLSASFDHTSYVLSFDDEMVAAALGERYGQGGYEAGQSFLEKIIQVPLHLPPPNKNALRQMTFEGVDAALTLAGIQLSKEQVDAFVRHFADGLEPGFETPRKAKLYVNALTFALPLLKGEAHPVDLMLIEGIRVFYPKLYTTIRNNPEYFLQGLRGAERDRFETRTNQVSDLLGESLEGMRARDQEEIRGLLVVLFPRLSNTTYGSDWDERWAREQRICSDQYFQRYFSYGVPPGDVSDVEVARLVDGFGATAVENQDATLRVFAERNAFPQLIRKLRERETEVDPTVALQLALAVARQGSLVPRERAAMMSDRTFRQAGILVAHLLKRIPGGRERESAAENVFERAAPLPFAFECLRWVRHGKDEPEAKRVLSKEAEERIAVIVSARIRAHATGVPLYLAFGTDAPQLYWHWNKQAGSSEVAEHLRVRFEAKPEEVDAFLDSFVGEAWEMESGLPRRADFERESYDAISRLVDTDLVARNLRERYGAELDKPEFHRGDELALGRRIAHQFMFIHQRVREEAAL